MTDARYRPALVAIDGDAERGTLPCLLPTDGETWNGWACPWFTESTVLAMAARFAAEDGMPALVIVGTGPTMTVRPVHDDDDPADGERETYAATVIDGEPYWPIGSWAWVWAELETCERDGCDALAFDLGECERHAYGDGEAEAEAVRIDGDAQ